MMPIPALRDNSQQCKLPPREDAVRFWEARGPGIGGDIVQATPESEQRR